MLIRIKNTQRKQKPRVAKLKRQIGIMLRAMRLPDAELSVFFTGDQAMRTLNRCYRGIDKTTDVLSFSFREGDFSEIEPNLLGDIVISMPVASRQADENGLTLHQEILRLLVHGLLHLTGYDHERGPREARRMRARERSLLAKAAV